jgi:hypothetical protein
MGNVSVNNMSVVVFIDGLPFFDQGLLGLIFHVLLFLVLYDVTTTTIVQNRIEAEQHLALKRTGMRYNVNYNCPSTGGLFRSTESVYSICFA